jgi:hypothetical protein
VATAAVICSVGADPSSLDITSVGVCLFRVDRLPMILASSEQTVIGLGLQGRYGIYKKNYLTSNERLGLVPRRQTIVPKKVESIGDADGDGDGD